MQKIIKGSDVKKLDNQHIQRKGVSSLMLMEKAALGFVEWCKSQGFPLESKIAVFCGAGNNGGDGFAIARLLSKLDYQVKVFACFSGEASLSHDAQANLNLLPGHVAVGSWDDFDSLEFDLLIDAYLGVGLQGELREEGKMIVKKINSFSGSIISVDIPSGMPSDSICLGICVRAATTVTFAFPKLSLLFPEHGHLTGELVLVDIGLEEVEFAENSSEYFFLQEKDISSYHKKFHRFSHKGDFGNVLLIAGNKGKMGAAILSLRSTLRTGSGLVSGFVPESERAIVQSSVPEAMLWIDKAMDFSVFDSIGIGPGIGVDQVDLVLKVLQSSNKPIVIDADALTILGMHPDLISSIPEGSILTPHLGEFDRIFGKSTDHLHRLTVAREFCLKRKLNVLIKGANSVICLSDGRQIFNSSGCQYMATAGAGDVLTGMLTSFLGQGYSPEQALICGVFHHGLAGEIAGKDKMRSMIASDLIESIPETFKRLGIS
jgi:ADP-dependent NAD(P)H-hydrate dehydratase / NAD(P)H-hydrate epimerase